MRGKAAGLRCIRRASCRPVMPLPASPAAKHCNPDGNWRQKNFAIGNLALVQQHCADDAQHAMPATRSASSSQPLLQSRERDRRRLRAVGCACLRARGLDHRTGRRWRHQAVATHLAAPAARARN